MYEHTDDNTSNINIGSIDLEQDPFNSELIVITARHYHKTNKFVILKSQTVEELIQRIRYTDTLI